MIENDIFADEAALAADLRVQECLLWARAQLPQRLIEAAGRADADLAEALRIESMYQFCEYFYLLRARRIETAEEIAALAEAHNDHLVALTRDKAKMVRLGLRPGRVLDAIFTADTLPRLIECWRNEPGCIDQSNLARLLVTVMSTETCRKLVVAATSAGFLRRRKAASGAVLVVSTGVMEQVFGGVLRDQRLRIFQTASEGSTP